MKTMKWLVAGLVCATAACTADPKGEQWEVGENNGSPANNVSANNETSNNEFSNNQTSNNEFSNNQTSNNEEGTPDPTDPGLPRGGLTQGQSCEVTLDCAAGLECVDVSEFEGPTERVCAEPECFCANPETSYCADGECALAGIECVLDGCPDNYECVENVCYCDSPECEGGCASDDHCGWSEMCLDGACRDAHCEHDSDCPTRYVCGGRSSDRICTVAGIAEVGDDCDRDEDCATGYCYVEGNICVQACQANSECGDRECVAPDHFDLFVPYCRAPECGDCDDDEFCNYDGTCDTDPCPDGECHLFEDI